VVEFLFGDVFCLVPGLSAAVAHDNVNFAEGLLGGLEEAVDFRDFADIGLDGDGFCAVAETFDDFDDFVGWAFGGDVVDDDGAAALTEFNGATTANSAAGTSDEGNFAFERGGGNCENHCVVLY